jgi:tRNA threonylcarbamoyladenosine biosynthesis protein TsaE
MPGDSADPPLDADWDAAAGRLICQARSLAGTDRLGAALGEAVFPGCVLMLCGELGSGKTRLVEAIAAGLGFSRDAVSSPTFVLVQEYEGRLPVYHFDTWRLRDSDEFLELGADELLEGDGVCCVEWGDRVKDVLPADRVDVRIAATGEQSRCFTLQATGPRCRQMLGEAAERLGAGEAE